MKERITTLAELKEAVKRADVAHIQCGEAWVQISKKDVLSSWETILGKCLVELDDDCGSWLWISAQVAA